MRRSFVVLWLASLLFYLGFQLLLPVMPLCQRAAPRSPLAGRSTRGARATSAVSPGTT